MRRREKEERIEEREIKMIKNEKYVWKYIKRKKKVKTKISSYFNIKELKHYFMKKFREDKILNNTY